MDLLISLGVFFVCHTCESRYPVDLAGIGGIRLVNMADLLFFLQPTFAREDGLLDSRLRGKDSMAGCDN